MPHDLPSEALTLPPPDREAPPPTLDYAPAAIVEAATLAPNANGGTATPPASVPGYEILGELGRGGMGVVYKARHVGLNRLVALKMVLAGGHASQEQRERFKAEAAAVAQLQHPNIVQIHDIGEHEGRPYFSLEFVAGGSLEHRLNGQPQPPRLAAELVEQLARAMQAAHDQGIIHRDLKPANVLLADKETRRQGDKEKTDASVSLSPCLLVSLSDVQPKVTDFGLAKSLEGDSAQTRTGVILGTPSYMAPEQAESRKDLTPAVDVYALGAILYEMLTGRPPFRAATPFDTVVQVVSEEPVPPRRLQSATPKDLETICLKCLEKDPRKRYGSAAALADDLRRFRADEPIQARPARAAEKLLKWCRRRPAIAALLAACLLGVFGVVWQWWRAATALVEVAQQKEQVEREREAVKQARDEAEKERQRAQVLLTKAVEAVDRLMLRVADARFARIEGFQEERRKMLEEAVAFQRSLLRLESRDPAVRRETGQALFKMAELYWHLGRNAEAEQVCREAIALHEQLAKEFPRQSQHRHDLAEGNFYLSHIQMTSGRAQDGAAPLNRALKLSEQLAQEEPGNAGCRMLLVKANISFGFHNLQTPGVGEKHLRRARELAWQLLQDEPGNADYQCLLAACCGHLATLLMQRPQTIAEAVALLEEARLLLEPDSGLAPAASSTYEMALAQNCVMRGLLLMNSPRRPEAVPLLRRGLGLYEQLVRVQPKSFMYRAQLPLYYLFFHQLLAEKEPAEAEAAIRRGIALGEDLARDHPDMVWILRVLQQCHSAYWDFLLKRGRWREAVAEAERLATQQPTGTNLYNAGCVCALGAEALSKESSPKEQAEQQRQRALDWLRKCTATGYFKDRARMEHLKQDKDLDGLRSRPDFQAWLREIEAALPGQAAP